MTNSRIPCKCCRAGTSLIGTLDFNKSCLDSRGVKPFPVSGEAVPYWGCPGCGFVFTTYTDSWTAADFKQRIYNAEYIKADPPIPGREQVPLRETPAFLKGSFIGGFFAEARKEIRVLDFGSGGEPGPTGASLIEQGFTVVSYDPFRAETRMPEGKFDLILAIEVFEHVNDLRKLGQFMQEHICRDGLLWIQTLLHPFPMPPNVLDSWYIAPRNGHISIFTLHALSVFLRDFGLNVVQTSVATLAFRNLPGFPNKLFVRA